ncbi:hypothetical protein HUJ04_003481 [Dendroctonus ponderosae]|nr:hypothetical protein HUJ04_003481 [Dendroctonus ponderosae]
MPDPVNEPPIQKSVRNLAEVVEVEPSAEEQEETDKVYEVFLKLAGEDKEVDWKELKEILDYSMQDGKF